MLYTSSLFRILGATQAFSWDLCKATFGQHTSQSSLLCLLACMHEKAGKKAGGMKVAAYF